MKQQLYTTVSIERCALIQIAFHTNVISDQRPRNQIIGIQCNMLRLDFSTPEKSKTVCGYVSPYVSDLCI